MGKDLDDLDNLDDKGKTFKGSLRAKSKNELFTMLEKTVSEAGAEVVSVDPTRPAGPKADTRKRETAGDHARVPKALAPETTMQKQKMKKVWLVGELHGGTRYTGKDLLLGLAKEFEEQLKKGDAPDAIYFMGDVLPDFGQFITRGQSAKTEVLEEGIEAIDDAVVAIKPHLTRIMDQIVEKKPGVRVSVVVGPNDRDNIRLVHDRIVQMYNKKTHYVYAQHQSYLAKVTGTEEIVADTEEMKKRYEEELKTLEMETAAEEKRAKKEKDKLLKKMEKNLEELKNKQGAEVEEAKVQLEKMRTANGKKIDDLRKRNQAKIDERAVHIKHLAQKIRENTEEAADDRAIMQLYDKLEDLWIKEHVEKNVEQIAQEFGGEATAELLSRIMRIRGPEAVDDVYKVAKDQLSKIDAALKTVNLDLERERYERLAAESKALSETLVASAELINLRAQYAQVNRELRGTDRDADKLKFATLEKQSKMLADRIRKQGWGGVESVKAAADKAIHELAEAGELYTHNLPGSKALHTLATEIALQEELAYLRTAFGRRMGIELLTNNITDQDIGFGHKIRISNNPKNTTSNYSRNILNELKQEAQMVDNQGVRFVVLGHSQVAEATVAPLRDKSEEIAHLYATSPLVDVAKLHQMWDEGIRGVKTRFTETVTKGDVSSGFWEVSFDDTKILETYKTSHYLLSHADREKREQVAYLQEMLRRLPLEPVDAEVDRIDTVQMRNKMPKDMNDALFAKLLKHNGIDPADEKTRKKLEAAIGSLKEAKREDVQRAAERPENAEIERMLNWCADYMFPYDGNETMKRVSFLMINDTHIGTTGYGLPTPTLIEGLVSYWKENEDHEVPVVLFLGGDNLEANHKFIKNELNKEIELKNIKAFEERLRRSLPDSALVKVKRDGYKAYLLDKLPIVNINEQGMRLASSLEPLIQIADGIILVSGQHFNKTYRERDRDEATELAGIIEHMTGKRKLPVMPMPGGDSGAGAVTINEDFGVFVAHKMPKRLERMALPQKVALGADSHVHDIKVQGDQVIAIGSASSVTNNYTTERGIPTSQSQRGFTRLTVTVAKDHDGEYNVQEAESEHISLELLKARGYVREDEDIKEFESTLTSMPVRMQTVKRQKERV